MERSKKLAKKAFNLIVRETKDEEAMDGDETEDLTKELLLKLDIYFANM